MAAIGFRASAIIIALAVVLAARPSAAMHTIFSFRVDRFEIDGNIMGPYDGAADRVEEFNGNAILSSWYVPYGTAVEQGGYLVLRNPGEHFPSPVGMTDVTIAGTLSDLSMERGSGSFSATSVWDPQLPVLGHHYHFSIITYGAGALFNEIFGVAVTRSATSLQLEQHLTEIDQFAGIYRNTMFDFLDIADGDVTGPIHIRLSFDDTTGFAESAISLDGGSTWLTPFGPAPLFVGRPLGQFLLSADPMIPGTGPTTTTSVTTTSSTTTTSTSSTSTSTTTTSSTTTSTSSSTTTTTSSSTSTTSTSSTTTSTTSSTTSTTIDPCDPTLCRRSTRPSAGRLDIRDRSGDDRDSLLWRYEGGAATSLAEFGNPAVDGTLTLCIANGTARWLQTVQGHALCGSPPCWKPSTKGWKLRTLSSAALPIDTVQLTAGADGKTRIRVGGSGLGVHVPALPLTLPLDVVLRSSTGVCWASTFTPYHVQSNWPASFRAAPTS